VANPLSSIIEGKYIGILFWAVCFGLVMKNIAAETTKRFMGDVADGISALVRHIINLAPFGIMGLVLLLIYGLSKKKTEELQVKKEEILRKQVENNEIEIGQNVTQD
jgi:Na+/serine symporter